MMPQTWACAPRTRGPVARAAFCLSLALGVSAPAADLAPVRPVSLANAPVAGALPRPVPRAEPEVELGLFQRLVLVLDALSTGRAATAPLAYGPPQRPGAEAVAVEVIPYPGPLPAGTIVLNLERFRVYRILEGGWAELYQERSKAAALARIGMVR